MAKERDKKMYVGIVFNYAAELKLLLAALFLLCVVATILQFLPSSFTISASDLRFCIAAQASSPPPPSLSSSSSSSSSSSVVAFLPLPHSPSASPPLSPSFQKDRLLDYGIIRRAFNPYGVVAYNFITMGAYRGGLHTFAIVGLASKPLHVYGHPDYQCEWVPDLNPSKPINGSAYKILPDWGYGRVYTVVVVNCTFSQPVNVDNSGGKLVLYASTMGGGDRSINRTDRMEVLTESPGSHNASVYTSKPKYEYLYCGSPLYGNLSPQRLREWLAYHVRLFGPKSHFVIHDAGGVHEEVIQVLKPWMELGYVSLHDIREQERFDGYYHNQFLVVNDCLHRNKFMSDWIFFFDVDEYIYVPPKSTIKSFLNSFSDYSQITIEQMPMSSKLCLSADGAKAYRKWGFEKLAYREVKKGGRRDRKYAVRPRNVQATGVHMSQNVEGKTTHKTEGKIKYFHYHGTIANRREPCRSLANSSEMVFDNTPYALDTTMRDVAAVVKRFELKMIGSRLQKTRQ